MNQLYELLRTPLLCLCQPCWAASTAATAASTCARYGYCKAHPKVGVATASGLPPALQAGEALGQISLEHQQHGFVRSRFVCAVFQARRLVHVPELKQDLCGIVFGVQTPVMCRSTRRERRGCAGVRDGAQQCVASLLAAPNKQQDASWKVR